MSLSKQRSDAGCQSLPHINPIFKSLVSILTILLVFACNTILGLCQFLMSWYALMYSRKSAVTDSSVSVSDDKSRRKEDLSLSCQLRYQSALVEVYTRFVMSDITQNPYMLHRKAVFRVTDFVRNRLHVVDKSVAQLRGCVVDGVKPGKTDIQVSI